MEPRTFHAREMKEALALVRRELGPDAIILGTRHVPGRSRGLLGGTLVEITAAGGTASPGSDAGTERAPAAAGRSQARAPLAADPAPIRTLLAHQRASRRQGDDAAPSLRRSIQDDPDTALAAAAGGPPSTLAPHAALRRRLLSALVPREVCEAWLRELAPAGRSAGGSAGGSAGLGPVAERAAIKAAQDGHVRALLHRRLGRAAPLVAPGVRVAALVGPTGVGKTTTIAKLAARAQLLEGRSVALVTVDDQRLGAATHLRAYADVLGVPVVHASAPGGLARALAELRDAELVLIDTAGISPSRPELFGQLGRRLQRAGEPVTTHLCVAAATRHEELDRLVHLYGEVEPSALLMTKADEAVAIGSVFGAQHDTGLPFSFVTTGQQVPDDIAQADPGLLIDLLLGGARA